VKLLAVLLATAPVYQHIDNGVARRIGTYHYSTAEGYTVLYCIATPPRVTLRCVVSAPDDMLAIIEVTATEAKT
jgi:hypothetical protein